MCITFFGPWKKFLSKAVTAINLKKGLCAHDLVAHIGRHLNRLAQGNQRMRKVCFLNSKISESWPIRFSCLLPCSQNSVFCSPLRPPMYAVLWTACRNWFFIVGPWDSIVMACHDILVAFLLGWLEIYYWLPDGENRIGSRRRKLAWSRGDGKCFPLQKYPGSSRTFPTFWSAIPCHMGICLDSTVQSGRWVIFDNLRSRIFATLSVALP